MLSAILSPITIERFLQDYFGTQPLLVRGAPGKFDALLKPSDFIYGLDQVTEIRCVFSELRQATISPADIREMFEAGATICVTGLERAHASLRRASTRIEKEIGYAGYVDFRGYMSPPGSGFDIHYDARVATTLQIDGTKTWWYSDEPNVQFPTENSPRNDMAAIHRVVSRVKLRKVTLRPGDLLCLPPGVWHKAEAGAGGSLALNMAFNHAGATVLDLVLHELREALAEQPGCREPFLIGQRNAPHPAVDSHVQTCIEAIREMIEPQGNFIRTQRLASSVHRRKQLR